MQDTPLDATPAN